MKFVELKALAWGLVLISALPGVHAALASDVLVAAANCKEGDTDPNCTNRIQERRTRPALPLGEPEMKRVQQQAEQRVQPQQTQQRAQQEEQQAQQRRQLEQQRVQWEQQQLRQKAQQEQQRVQQQQTQQRAQQEEQQAQQRRQQEQQRVQQEQQRAQQQQAEQRAQLEQQVRQKAQQEQQRAQQQQAQQRAQQEEQQAQQRRQQEQQRMQQEQQRAQQQQAEQRAQLEQQVRQKAQQEQQRAQQQVPPENRRPGVQGQPVPPVQPPATAQVQPSTGDRRVGTELRRPLPAQPVAVDAATSVVPRGDRNSFDIRHKNADGSQMVISQMRRPDGTQQVMGVKQTEDAHTGTTTQVYSDGRRVTQGRDFERSSVGSGLDFVTRRNGLREAVMPDGKPAFQDRFTSFRDRDGNERKVIERTRYARWLGGRPAYEPQPVVRQYDVGQIYGAPTAYYLPSRYEPGAYSSYYAGFAAPVALAAAAGTAWVTFGSPVARYNDPLTLMGDLQIASGFEEGYAYATPSGATPVYDTPEAAALRSQMAAVQQQVQSSVQGNAALKGQLGGMGMQATSSQVQQAVGGAVPVQISEEVRQQVRKQVRLSVAMIQNGKPLVLGDVLAGGYARIYLFQTAQPLNVVNLSNGSGCFLHTGDLIGFLRLPAVNTPVAEMKVVASGASSCPAGEGVQVRLTDLQDMLNGFTERVEDNMKRVNACAASGRC